MKNQEEKKRVVTRKKSVVTLLHRRKDRPKSECNTTSMSDPPIVLPDFHDERAPNRAAWQLLVPHAVRLPQWKPSRKFFRVGA